MDYGVLCLLPMATLFAVVLTTKRVLLAITAATMVGAVILGGPHFVSTWLLCVQEGIGGPNSSAKFLLLLLSMFGIFITLLEVSGAVTDFAMFLSKYANSRKKSMLLTMILGLIIFVDDALNNLAIATSMKKITDSHGVPRTILGYIVNSTAAPVCILVPLSSWAVFYAGLYEANGVTVNGTGMGAYIASIPYMFYAWITPIVIVLVVMGIIPMLGVNKKFEKLAREDGIVISEGVGIDDKVVYAEKLDNDSLDGKRPMPWNFIITMAVLIVVTLACNIDVLMGCFAASVTISILMLIEKKITIKGLLDAVYAGVKSMTFMYVQTALIWTLVAINTSVGLTPYVIKIATPLLIPSILPAVVFAVCSVYSYFGGGFWDMAAIMMPIVIPLANIFGVDPCIAGAALISSTAFGSNTYVCGDGVIITSQTVGIKPIYQMYGTLPYALISAVISFVLYLIVGFVK